MTEDEQQAALTDVVAEQSVLGGAMLDKRALDAVLQTLQSSDMYQPRHAVLFDAIVRVHDSKIPVDAISVVDELIKTGELQRAGGAEYVHGITGVVPTTANVDHYADIVREYSLRRSLVDVATRVNQSIGSEPGQVLADTMRQLEQLRDRDARASKAAGMKSLRQVLDVPEDEDEYEWVVPDLLERRDRLILTGSEGGGKSTLLRQIAVCAAAGVHPFTHQKFEPVRVMVVDTENSEKQWRRAVRGLVKQAGYSGVRDPADHVMLNAVPRMDLTRAADLAEVHRMMDRAKPDLLLIGPLYRLIPRAIQSDDDAAPLLAALDTLRERGPAMLIEAHAGHATSNAGERDLRPRGSAALLGWPEFGLGLRRAKEQGSHGRI